MVLAANKAQGGNATSKLADASLGANRFISRSEAAQSARHRAITTHDGGVYRLTAGHGPYFRRQGACRNYTDFNL
jgi:hypothetical protein